MGRMLVADTICGSTVCPHKGPHEEHPVFCHDGGCRWNPECRCVDSLEYEIRSSIMAARMSASAAEMAQAIMELLKERGIYDAQ